MCIIDHIPYAFPTGFRCDCKIINIFLDENVLSCVCVSQNNVTNGIYRFVRLDYKMNNAILFIEASVLKLNSQEKGNKSFLSTPK